jgi:hypothetical protein
MRSHYLVDPVACTPAVELGDGAGREPGRLVRERFFAACYGLKTKRLAARQMVRILEAS